MKVPEQVRRFAVRAAWSVGLAAVAGVCAASAGGGFSLQGSAVAGGGVSRAKSACFDLSATIGEPVAGSAANDTFSLVSGFWAAPVARPDTVFRSSFESCAP